MSKSKAELVEEAKKYGINNGADMPYGQLEQSIREIKNGGAIAHKASRIKITASRTKVRASASGGGSSSKSKPVKTALTAKGQAKKAQLDSVAAQPLERELRVRFYQDHEGDWRWTLLATNGRIVADSSEGYATKWGCKRAFKKFIGL